MTLPTVARAAIQLIKDGEGLRLRAYPDTGGVWTIGYGHTGADVKPGLVISMAQANDLFTVDLAEAATATHYLFPKATTNQFSALVSFVFNLGQGQVGKSTLRKLHNAGDFASAAKEFDKWVHDNGRKLPGLVKRRAAEKALYLTPG